MYSCPTCKEALDRNSNRLGLYHTCHTCHGRFVGMGVLRKAIERDAVNRVWRAACDGAGVSSRPCPVCAANMSEVNVGNHVTHVDVCIRCHMVWFDGGEYEVMPPSGIVLPPELSEKARAVLAFHKIKQIEAQADYLPDVGESVPDAWWQFIPAIFNMPVEMQTRSLSRWPLVTWGCALLAVIVFILTKDNLPRIVDAWGFIPAYPLRHGGLTLMSSMLLHGSWLHLLVNIYFLMIFSDDVEEYLGPAKLVLLMAFASISGCLFHLAVRPESILPLVGISGVVSAIMCFYTFLHPHARIGILIGRMRNIGWITMSAHTAFVVWMLLQGVGVWIQIEGFSNVSAMAHLGGILVGLFAWHFWRDQP
jgi:membrane associated rhomboid family serine protease/Zn-finger nucleic acid-binding protein